MDALYDELYDELGRRTLVGASDGFGAVIYAIAPTGDMATVIDDLIAT